MELSELEQLGKQKAERVIAFCERLTLGGDYSGKPVKLLPYQKEIIYKVFGTLKPDGFRQYKFVNILLPRKQGKSYYISLLILYFLIADSPGHNIYSIAITAKQSALLFDFLLQMIRKDKYLQKILTVNKTLKRISCYKTESHYQVLANENSGPSNLGTNPSVVISDESCFNNDNDNWAALTSGSGSRRQPLFFSISSAGVCNPDNFGFQLFEYSKKVESGEIKDDSFYSYMKYYDEKKHGDPFDEKTWFEIMPALGTICEIDFIRNKALQAKNIPSEYNNFMQFYLNRFTNQLTRWIPMESFNKCMLQDFPDLTNKTCFVGIDLSKVRDTTCYTKLFFVDNKYYAIPKYYLPEDSIEEKEKLTNKPWRQWAEQGYITLTAGNCADYRTLRSDIERDAKLYDIKQVSFDPWNSTETILELQDRTDIECIQWFQTFKYQTAPCKKLETLIVNQDIYFPFNPITRFMFNNVSIITDNNDNIRPTKRPPASNSIDIVTCTLNALGASMQSDWLDNSPQVLLL